MSDGFGLIKTAQLEDFLFQSKDLEGVEFDSLSEGQEVEFEEEEGYGGRPRAVKVRLA